MFNAHGQYINGRCDGSGTSDVQKCTSCRLCDPGHYPTGLCDGRSFSDTVECRPCLTSCPAGQYLKGDCRVEEVKCVACDAPCANQSQFLQETRACSNGLNRVCEPTTRCKVSYLYFALSCLEKPTLKPMKKCTGRELPPRILRERDLQ